MSTKDSEALEQQRQRRNRINRMKTGIIVTITVWMLVSLLAIILLTVQVARLSSHVKRLEKAGQTTVSQNIPDSENVQAADKNTNVTTFLERTLAFGFEHYKDFTYKEQIDRAYDHAEKKFGKNGYAVNKYYVKDDKYEKYLKELQDLIENKEEYHEKSEDFTAPVCARRVPVCRFDDHRHAESVVFRQLF